MSKNMYVVEGVEFLSLDQGIYVPDDQPDKSFAWYQIVTDMGMTDVRHPVGEALYRQLEDAKLQYGDKLDLTYPIRIKNGKLRLDKVVAFKKVK